MRQKFNLFKIGIFLAIILGLSFSSVSAATYTWDGDTDGNWNVNANWAGDPATLPGAGDDVEITSGTANSTLVTLPSGTVTIKSLLLKTGGGDDGDVKLQPAATDTELVVLGNITIDVDADDDHLLKYDNGTGRLNLTIGVTGSSTSSVITSNQATVAGTSGITVNNLTLINATVQYAIANAGDLFAIYGNVDLQETSTFTPSVAEAGEISFAGATTKTINRSATSFIDFANMTIAAGTVTTDDDITVSDALTITGVFTQSSPGTFFFENTTGGDHTDVFNSPGTATFYNLNINCTTNLISSPNATHTDITVAGDFTKTGSGAFTNASKIIFDNTASKEITVSGGQDKMITEGIEIAANSRVVTNSSFTIGVAASVVPTFEVKALGSFAAATGEINFDIAFGTGTITNLAAQDTSLKFFDILIDGGANTLNSAALTDFRVGGNFNIAAGDFIALNGSDVTFDNNVSKTITATATTSFYGLVVAGGSEVTSASSFVVANNGGTTDNAKIELGASAKLTLTGTVTMGGAAEDVKDKNITVGTSGELKIATLVVADQNNNTVKTDADFEITGTGAGVLSCVATNTATFEATAGTITFTGAAPVIAGDDDSFALKLFNIAGTKTGAGPAIGVTAADWLEVAGNITLDADATFKAAAETTDITLTGTAKQTLTGSGTYPFEFGVLIIDKGAITNPSVVTDYVELAADVTFVDNAASTLTLTNGILDLGTKKLKLVDGIVNGTTGDGLIHGRTGQLVIEKAITTWTLAFADALFTVDGNPTLYDLIVGTTVTGEDETIGGDLTINNDIELVNGDLIIGTNTLTIKGDLKQTTNTEKIQHSAGATIVLDGSGTCTPVFDNTLFTPAEAPNLTIMRDEVLTGNLTMDDAQTLTMNSGNKQLDLVTYTLEFADGANPALISVVSGTIKSATGSKVIFNDNQTLIPANMFFNNEVQDIELKVAMELGGDLIINGAHTGAFNVTTGTNVLTLGPSATEAFTDNKNVIGRLRRTVAGATSTLFEIGGGATNDYRGVEIKFSNSSTSQIVEVSSSTQNPTTGRVGNPEDALNATWTITPQGTVSNALDSVNVKFLWGSNHLNGLALGKLNPANLAEVETFATRYKDNAWVDYSTSHAGATSVVDGDPDQLLMNGWAAYPLKSTDFGGTWAVFDDDSPSTHSDALETSGNKLVFTSMPSNIGAGLPFSATVEYQDQFGNPVLANVTDGAMTVQIEKIFGLVIGGTTMDAVIPVGSSSVTFNGVTLPTAGTPDNQIKATATTAAYSTTKIGISSQIDVLSAEPSISGKMITFPPAGVKNRSLTFTVEGGAAQNAIIVAKQTSAIATTDFPVDGQTYVGNQTMGAGSVIGNGVVVFKGAVVTGANTVKVSGLAPMTTYHFRVFTYAGDKGTENYRTIPGPLSFNSKATIGTTDDDVEYGSNNTQADAKPIGTNTEVQGRISSSTDVDWFSFTVTSAAANIRVKLTNVPTAKNYNLEIYNAAGRRVRRGMLKGTANESLVINDLVSGTYSVRVYGQDSDNDATNAYKVKVETKGTEIFSVTQ